MTAADFIPGPAITDPAYLHQWVQNEEAMYIGDQWTPCKFIDLAACRSITIRRALRRTQPQTVQQKVDEALAQAQTAIDAARKVCVTNGRIGLRQHAALLSGELDETRAQTARCCERGNIEVEARP